MNKSLLIAGAVVVLGIVGYVVYQRSQTISPTPEMVMENESSDTTPFISSTPDTSELEAGGSSFSDPAGTFTFLYPSEYELHTDDPQHIRISKRGETQRAQSEMSDGVLVVFEPINLGDKTLEEYVDTHIQESTANGMSEVIQAKKPSSLNNYPGITYSLRGLGETSYLVLQKDAQSDKAVSISFLVADPENKGYQQELESILSTLELH